MARIFQTGFEFQNLAEVPGSFISNTGSGEHGYTGGRWGSYCFYVATTGWYNKARALHVNVPAQPSEFFYRGAHRITGSQTWGTVLAFVDVSGNTLCRIDGDTSNWTAHVGGSSVASGSWSITAWRLIRVHYKPGTPGEFQLYIDDDQVANWGGDTNVSYGNLGRFYFQCQSGHPNSAYHYCDDVAINDPSGTANNGLPSDGYIQVLLPNGNGDASEWTGSDSNQVDNYLLVDEAGHDSDSTYVLSTEAGPKDLYNLSTISLGLGERIVTIQPLAIARAYDASATMSIQLGLKTNNTEVWSEDIDLGTTYNGSLGEIYEVNPVTDVNWTQGEIDVLQVGVKRTH
jgi:hypothetical protein